MKIDLGSTSIGRLRTKSTTNNTGKICEIHNYKTGFLKEDLFEDIAWDAGGSFVTLDKRGRVYIFDILNNKFQYVTNVGSESRSVCFGSRRELLVATTSHSLLTYSLDSRKLVSSIRGHKVINAANENKVGIFQLNTLLAAQLCICTSPKGIVVWYLDKERQYKKQSFYMPSQDLVQAELAITSSRTAPVIVTCFGDGSILFWNSESLALEHKLTLPREVGNIVTCFTLNSNAEYCAVASSLNEIIVWNLQTKTVHRILKLSGQVRGSIEQIQFVPSTVDMLVLDSAFVWYMESILSLENEVTLFPLITKGNEVISRFSLAPSGKYCIFYTAQGHLELIDVPVRKQFIVNGADVRISQSFISITDTSASLPEAVERKEQMTSSVRLAKLDQKAILNNQTKLFSILHSYGEFPAKYRLIIWQFLLHLPENFTAFNNLVNKGKHMCFSNLHQTFPLKDRRMYKKLEKMLSCLAHWCELFCALPYIPAFIFPFVKLINSDLVCFEVITTILTNWCKDWYKFFPEPPLHVLQTIERILTFHDASLSSFLATNGISSELYAWTLMQTWFTEVFSKEEWLTVMDHLLAHSDDLTLPNFVVVAFVLYFKPTIMTLKEFPDFEYFFHKMNTGVEVHSLLELAQKLRNSTPSEILGEHTPSKFAALAVGQYGVFVYGAEQAVAANVKRQDQIVQEELQILQEKSNFQLFQENMEKLLRAEHVVAQRQQKMKELQGERIVIESLADQFRRRDKKKEANQIKEQRLHLMEESVNQLLQHSISANNL